jgi:hypothetical protein
MEKLEIENSPKLAAKNECKCCDYICSKESDFKKHLATAKHEKTMNGTNMEIIGKDKFAEEYNCAICQKNYKTHSGLWKHMKKCIPPEPATQPSVVESIKPPNELDKDNLIEMFIKENSDFKNIILELVKSNADLQKQMIEVCKNSNNTTIHKNSHNKTFNMQIFLNEHCKDAMNIKDFADSFKLEISDFEKVGHLGYVDGISDIIIKKLNEMDVHKRPIHCSDTKRDIMYVHADNVWTKENSEHEQVRLLVQRITAKNIRLIPIWQDMYPNSRNNMHQLNDTYMSLTRQAMGGFGGTIPENETKIIKKIAKTVFIDKHM